MKYNVEIHITELFNWICIHKYTWMSVVWGHWALLDYVPIYKSAKERLMDVDVLGKVADLMSNNFFR